MSRSRINSLLKPLKHFFQLFEVQANLHTANEKIAIYYDDQTKITYKDLNNLANQLAYCLLEKIDSNSKEECCIGLYFNLSIEYFISVIAIMKAGLTFVSLSAKNEAERTKAMTDKINISFFLSESTLKNTPFLNTLQKNIIFLDQYKANLKRYSNSNPSIDIDLGQLAYIHNTSGSTGEPKQVLINYSGLLNCATDLINRLSITEKDKTAAYADISFDAHLAEMMMTLGAGATLYLVPTSTRTNYLSLTHYYNSHSITVATLTPSVLSALSPKAFDSLRILLSTGEAIADKVINKWYREKPNLLFVNGYGPAEVTIATSIAILKPGEPVHIGSPIKGLKIYVLEKKPQDKNAPQWVKPEERGEMYIAGDGVGRGYLDEKLTEERFVTVVDPDNTGKKVRLYKTCDEAKYEVSVDNNYRYYVCGRLDRQVKIYGKLICPEEIEANLLSDEVMQAQIDTQKTKCGAHPAFIAYLYVKDSFDLYEYYSTVVKKLPTGVAPARWVISHSPVLNLSSKNALNSLEEKTVRVHSHSPLKPKTETEKRLAQIWKEILEISDNTELTIDDNFFMLGGTSLQLTNFLTRLRNEMGIKLTSTEFSFTPTLGSLGRYIARLKEKKVVLIPLNEKELPDKTETPLFLIHSLMGDAENDYHEIVPKWPSQRPLYGISARAYQNIDDMDNNLDAIAKDYIATMKLIQPRGPYLLGGWSAGGIIAYAMCQILTAQNETVHLHMIDSESFSTYRNKTRSEYAAYLFELFEIKLSGVLGIGTIPLDKQTLERLPKTQQIYQFFNVVLLEVEKNKESKQLLYNQGLITSIKNTLLAILNYDGKIKVVNAILWAATKTQAKYNDPKLLWKEHEIQFRDIRALDGSHESILLDALSAKTFSFQLEQECILQMNAVKKAHSPSFYRSYSQNSQYDKTQRVKTSLISSESKTKQDNIDNNIVQLPNIVNQSEDVKYLDVSRSLRDFYKTKNTVPPALLAEHAQPINDINLSIVKINNNNKQQPQDNYDKRDSILQYYENIYEKADLTIPVEDVFGGSKTRKSAHILILGHPGIGKSTMSQYMAYRWHEEKLWPEFKFLFWIPLKNLRNKYYFDKFNLDNENRFLAVAKIILRECGLTNEIPLNILENLIKEKRSDVLYILDGFDEVSTLLSDESENIVKILFNVLFAQKNIILTSRPYRFYHIQKNFDLILENNGFTEIQINSYITNYYKSMEPPQPERATELKIFLNNDENIRGMVHIPLNLALMCGLWQNLANRGKKLDYGTDITKLYTDIVTDILKKYLKRLQPQNQLEINDWSYPQVEKKCLRELYLLKKIAFESLKSPESVLIEPELQKRVINEFDSTAAPTDIGTRPSVVILTEIGFIKNLGEIKQELYSSYKEFSHLTFQEYFAAAYIADILLEAKENDTNYKDVIDFIKYQKFNSFYSIVFKFLAGILSSLSNYHKAKLVFWENILTEPFDLLEINFTALLINLIDAAKCDSDIPQLNIIIEYITQWITYIFVDRASNKSCENIQKSLLSLSLSLKKLHFPLLLGKKAIKPISPKDASVRNNHFKKKSLDNTIEKILQKEFDEYDYKDSFSNMRDAQPHSKSGSKAYGTHFNDLLSFFENKKGIVQLNFVSDLLKMTKTANELTSLIEVLIKIIKENGNGISSCFFIIRAATELGLLDNQFLVIKLINTLLPYLISNTYASSKDIVMTLSKITSAGKYLDLFIDFFANNRIDESSIEALITDWPESAVNKFIQHLSHIYPDLTLSFAHKSSVTFIIDNKCNAFIYRGKSIVKLKIPEGELTSFLSIFLNKKNKFPLYPTEFKNPLKANIFEARDLDSSQKSSDDKIFSISSPEPKFLDEKLAKFYSHSSISTSRLSFLQSEHVLEDHEQEQKSNEAKPCCSIL